MLFSAIAMIAFSLNSSAQTGISTIDLSDVLDCSKKADEYARNLGIVTEDYYKAMRSAYFKGCMDGKKKWEAPKETTTKTLTK